MGKRKDADEANHDDIPNEKSEPLEDSGDAKEYYIDESGFLVNPSLVETEQRKSRDERLGTVPLPKRARKKKATIPNKPVQKTVKKKAGKKSKKNKIPGSLKQSNKLITRTDTVKCPICGAKRIYGELFTHVEIYHPKENAKKVLDQFNRLHGIGKYKRQT